MTAPRLFLIVVLSLVTAAAAQQPTPSPQAPQAPPPPACEGPEFRQFDFWLGSWRVVNAKEEPAGASEVSRVSDGCAVWEQWQGKPPGMSLNYFDRADGAWHQVWVGGGGGILHLKGGLENGVMVMTGGDRKTPQGIVRDRMRWTPHPDGSVVQEWEISTDGGKTWRPSYSGRYRKR